MAMNRWAISARTPASASKTITAMKAVISRRRERAFSSRRCFSVMQRSRARCQSDDWRRLSGWTPGTEGMMSVSSIEPLRISSRLTSSWEESPLPAAARPILPGAWDESAVAQANAGVAPLLEANRDSSGMATIPLQSGQRRSLPAALSSTHAHRPQC